MPVKLKEVEFGDMEGSANYIKRFKGRRAGTFEAANRILHDMAFACRLDGLGENMGCYKTDVKVTWEDGTEYGARIEMTPNYCQDRDWTLEAHIRQFATCYSGRLTEDKMPSHWEDRGRTRAQTYEMLMSRVDEEHRAFYGKILDAYALSDAA